MIKRHPVSNTYARALMELAIEHDKVDETFEELEALAENVFSKVEFRVFFESPKIPRAEKKKVLGKCFEGKISPRVLHFLDVLIDRGRQALFDEIRENFTERYHQHKRLTHVRVQSAIALNQETRKRLTDLLAKNLDREIVMKDAVDEELLGGMTIRFGDTFVDGSIRTQLNKVREAIASPHLGSDLFDENQR